MAQAVMYTSGEPMTLEECQSSNEWEEWQKAINAELASLSKHKVLKGPVEQPPHKHLVDSKWVFTRKRDAEGNIVKYKARLVARGFSQRPGFDFEETYAPVLDMVSYRILLALATAKKWNVHTMDVVTAYLYGDLEHEIYMRVPHGFHIPDNMQRPCMKIEKSLYGLKQSGR